MGGVRANANRCGVNQSLAGGSTLPRGFCLRGELGESVQQTNRQDAAVQNKLKLSRRLASYLLGFRAEALVPGIHALVVGREDT